jgi:hypothetical protein
MASLHLPQLRRPRVVAVAVAGVIVGMVVAGALHFLAVRQGPSVESAAPASSVPARSSAQGDGMRAR